MDAPASKALTTALMAGLVAGIAALVVIEVIDLVVSRIAHHQSKNIETEVWNYYAVRDATAEFLGNLHARATDSNGDGPSGERREPAREHPRQDA